MKLLIINGPNLNLLGIRETEHYGRQTLEEMMAAAQATAESNGATAQIFQSNHEGELIDAIHEARKDCDGIIINPAGYGHTSVALRDALLAVKLPTIEVHLTNIAKREEFRHRTLTADVAVGQINGLGAYGYQLAVLALLEHLTH